MIIGYDFWNDYCWDSGTLNNDNTISSYPDYDGVAFNNCAGLAMPMQHINIRNGDHSYLEVLINETKNIENATTSNEWQDNTLMLALFNGDLSAGSVNVRNHEISSIQFLKRKLGETEWQVCKEFKYNKTQDYYSFIDKYIEAEQEYEYCIRPVAKVYDDTGRHSETLYGECSVITSAYVTFNHTFLFDKDESYNLLYDFKLGDITSNIDANMITTLSGQYPFVVYGASKYKSGSIECLLVTEESATGMIDVGAEKVLRNNIDKFLSNKKPKILKADDGTYLLISISDNYSLIPNNNLLGSYRLSFNYTEIGDANDIQTLKKFNLWSDE